MALLTRPLQWGHGLSAVETANAADEVLQGGKAFNGATAFQPWKPPRRHLHPTNRTRFNGATAFQPWKLGGDTYVSPVRKASMGPRPFSRGNRSASRTAVGIGPSFNGATAFQPWKRD